MVKVTATAWGLIKEWDKRGKKNGKVRKSECAEQKQKSTNG